MKNLPIAIVLSCASLFATVPFGEKVDSGTATFIVSKYANNPFASAVSVFAPGSFPGMPFVTHGVMINVKSNNNDTASFGITVTAKLKTGQTVTRVVAVDRWRLAHLEYTTEVVLMPGEVDSVEKVEIVEVPPQPIIEASLQAEAPQPADTSTAGIPTK